MNDIVIKKSSSLYKLIMLLSATPILNQFINKYRVFNDICTFTRSVLLTLLISLPCAVVVASLFLYVVLFNPVLQLISNEPLSYFVTVQLWVYFITLIYYVLSVFVELFLNLKLEKHYTILPTGETNSNVVDANISNKRPLRFIFLRDLWKLISNKHNEYCKRLKIEN